MKELTFSNLIKIFGAAQATDLVQRYVYKDYVELKKFKDKDDVINQQIKFLRNDPNTFVMAMQINDKEWNKKEPVNRAAIGYVDDECKIPIYTDTGPLRDPHGKYLVNCPEDSFYLRNGDFVVLTSDNWKDLNNIEIMPQDQFKAAYTTSENTDYFNKEE